MDNNKKILIIFFIGIMVFIFSKYFYQLGFVNGISMEPSLKDKQLIIIKKNNINVKKKDIVLIKRKNRTIIKRLVGVPGDKLEVKGGYLYVNNKKYDNNRIVDSGNLKDTIKLGEKDYYVLGDNAEYSDDSRYWEDPFVSHEDVIAKLFLPESEERNSGILCASLVGDAHKERSSGLNCTGRPFFSFGGAVTDG